MDVVLVEMMYLNISTKKQVNVWLKKILAATYIFGAKFVGGNV